MHGIFELHCLNHILLYHIAQKNLICLLNGARGTSKIKVTMVDSNPRAVQFEIPEEVRRKYFLPIEILGNMYTLPQKKRNLNFRIFHGDPGPGSVIQVMGLLATLTHSSLQGFNHKLGKVCVSFGKECTDGDQS